ncbi:hypothetical protein K6Y74_27775 [Burkholderia cenocepacia]|uniref:hypothetical protein n=1 Tax=Burkholderia cepacia complex TaxID=87882 RepID=UPI000CFFAFFD|nr:MULTISPECIES: hypothetical protein [Burkholderia cepacia complex]MBJ9625972.1 hypothetical protein [Burkholderia multivorans]MBU9550494.1 hypothetical protein [Burkholderia multivorans]MCW3647066.1 hypothetical protein [Burkholderia cenocepacia]MEB2540425.1 hypothetical protein [Burkholderia cenocepacia]PRF31084.1 hypothetical protein C6Q10_31570 [Burkholderia multivorans]
MTTNNTNISGVPTASNEIDPDSLIAALDALQPNARQQKEDRFREIFPSILAAERRGVTQSKIIKVLKEQGLSLSIGGYKVLYDKVASERPDGDMNASSISS